jgi:hypothetical protein
MTNLKEAFSAHQSQMQMIMDSIQSGGEETGSEYMEKDEEKFAKYYENVEELIEEYGKERFEAEEIAQFAMDNGLSLDVAVEEYYIIEDLPTEEDIFNY